MRMIACAILATGSIASAVFAQSQGLVGEVLMCWLYAGLGLLGMCIFSVTDGK